MPPSARMLATRLVVVVLPCVPAMAMPLLQAHQFSQHLGARNHRNMALTGGDHFRVVALDRR
jgi:hypothetical protein